MLLTSMENQVSPKDSPLVDFWHRPPVRPRASAFDVVGCGRKQSGKDANRNESGVQRAELAPPVAGRDLTDVLGRNYGDNSNTDAGNEAACEDAPHVVCQTVSQATENQRESRSHEQVSWSPRPVPKVVREGGRQRSDEES